VQVGFFVVYVVVAIGVFYLLVLRPSRRRLRAQQALIAAVKTDDRVVTREGMCGTVREVRDTSVVVEIAQRTTVRLQRQAIVQVVSPEEPRTRH
jgi:preprotein translocase subunit YajC